MSGAISVPLALAAIIWGGQPGRWFELLAFVALWICVIRIGMVNYAMLEKIKPRITTSCERAPAIGAASLRLKIESLSDAPIRNCQARIIQIKKEGDGAVDARVHSAPLMFAPNEQKIFEKTIAPRSLEIVDVVLVGEQHFLPGTLDNQWVSERCFKEYFVALGDYFLTIEIFGDMPTEVVVLKFTWNGDWRTASLEKVERN